MIYKDKERLYLELALFLNNRLFNEKNIDILVHDKAQEQIFKRIKKYEGKNGFVQSKK